jgi:hypothetical protein
MHKNLCPESCQYSLNMMELGVGGCDIETAKRLRKSLEDTAIIDIKNTKKTISPEEQTKKLKDYLDSRNC